MSQNRSFQTLREAGISLSGMRPRFAPVRNEGNLANPGSDFLSAIFGNAGPLGQKVNEFTAMGISTVFACVGYLSDILGTLPLDLYKGKGSARMVAERHPARVAMTIRPNREMTPAVLRCTMAANYALHGNAYAKLIYDNGGRIAEIWPLPSKRVTLLRSNGFPYYRVQTDAGVEFINFEKMLHIQGLSFNGMLGIGPLQLAANLIGLAQALEDNAGRFFANGSRPGMIYSVAPGITLTEPQKQSIKEQLNSAYQGVENFFKTMVLEGGGKMEMVRSSNDSSQFDEISIRTHQEICRFFGVPPHKVGILENATFSNIEQQQIQAVQDKFLPMCVRWEQAFSGALLSGDELFTHEFKHDLNGMMRGDSAAKSASYVSGINNGYYTPNDVRKWEELPPLPGGDKARIPLNLGLMDAPAPEPKPIPVAA